MNINKAIRKQKKTYKRFLLSMCFIFVLLPIVLILSKLINIFFFSYLVCIELLIFDVVLLRLNEEYLDFKLDKYRIIIRCGLAKIKYTAICEKIVLIHTKGEGKNFEIIIITKSRFRNKKICPIDLNFLKKYPYVAHKYSKMKIQNPEEGYFYFIIRKGGFKKYILLDGLYKNCVNAIFSDEAIEKIKEYRE